MADPTGLAKTARVEIRGLAEGAYAIRYAGRTDKVRSGGKLELAIPLGMANSIVIEKA